MRLLFRHRSLVVRFCLATLLVLGFASQQHALSHALQSLAQHDALAGHAPCEQCLQFAAANAAPPSAAAVWQPPAPVGHVESVATLAWRTEAFTAYASRAPPRNG